MQCTVYKSLKQYDYYLYVRTEEGFSRVPENLQVLLGTLEKIIELELYAERKLAQADVVAVMAGIDASGYYLQMPPRPESAPLLP